MDVVKAVQGYITKIVNGTTGIKVLLLDNNTVLSLSILKLINRLPLYSYPKEGVAANERSRTVWLMRLELNEINGVRQLIKGEVGEWDRCDYLKRKWHRPVARVEMRVWCFK